MNILTIGVPHKTTAMLDQLCNSSENRILHLFEKDQALRAIKEVRNFWDWVILQGQDDPSQWSSILCAISSSSINAQVTVLSSHIDGTRIKTPVCSMHTNNGKNLEVSRCAMQSLLQQDERQTIEEPITNDVSPIVFEYHAPCR